MEKHERGIMTKEEIFLHWGMEKMTKVELIESLVDVVQEKEKLWLELWKIKNGR